LTEAGVSTRRSGVNLHGISPTLWG
jgi:hypothetical protein